MGICLVIPCRIADNFLLEPQTYRLNLLAVLVLEPRGIIIVVAVTAGAWHNFAELGGSRRPKWWKISEAKRQFTREMQHLSSFHTTSNMFSTDDEQLPQYPNRPCLNKVIDDYMEAAVH